MKNILSKSKVQEIEEIAKVAIKNEEYTQGICSVNANDLLNLIHEVRTRRFREFKKGKQ